MESPVSVPGSGPDAATIERAIVLAVEEIDRQNAADPSTVIVDGSAVPLALAHGVLADRWMTRLYPDRPWTWSVAARGHHLRRWELPRSSFPAGRAGYLRWRTEQKRRHGEFVAEVLTSCGLGDFASETAELVERRDLRVPGCRALEDAACLAFAETQLDAVHDALGSEQTTAILTRTMTKMSDHGRAAFLGLDLPHARAATEALRSTTEGDRS